MIDSKNNKFLGLLDVVDILSFLVSVFENHKEEQSEDHDIFKKVLASHQYSSKTIGEIKDFSTNPFMSVVVGTSCWELLDIFVNKKSHRCPVVTEEGKMISILTQSALVNFLALHLKDLGKLGKLTIQELNIGTSPVFTMNKTDKSIDAFKYMADHNISGVGITDQSKKLIGNISARDLKSVPTNQIYNFMTKQTGQFISHVKQQSLEEDAPVIACQNDTHFDFVIGRMAANHIHRLYVCDKDHKPLAIISLRDVLQTIYNSSK